MQTMLAWTVGIWLAVATMLLVRLEYLVLFGGMSHQEPREHFSDRVRTAFLWPFILIEFVVEFVRAINDDEEEGA